MDIECAACGYKNDADEFLSLEMYFSLPAKDEWDDYMREQGVEVRTKKDGEILGWETRIKVCPNCQTLRLS